MRAYRCARPYLEDHAFGGEPLPGRVGLEPCPRSAQTVSGAIPRASTTGSAPSVLTLATIVWRRLSSGDRVDVRSASRDAVPSRSLSGARVTSGSVRRPLIVLSEGVVELARRETCTRRCCSHGPFPRRSKYRLLTATDGRRDRPARGSRSTAIPGQPAPRTNTIRGPRSALQACVPQPRVLPQGIESVSVRTGLMRTVSSPARIAPRGWLRLRRRLPRRRTLFERWRGCACISSPA